MQFSSPIRSPRASRLRIMPGRETFTLDFASCACTFDRVLVAFGFAVVPKRLRPGPWARVLAITPFWPMWHFRACKKRPRTVPGALHMRWWSEGDLNPRHADFQSAALPTELPDHDQPSMGTWDDILPYPIASARGNSQKSPSAYRAACLEARRASIGRLSAHLSAYLPRRSSSDKRSCQPSRPRRSLRRRATARTRLRAERIRSARRTA